jgi:hypothetical protein
MTQITLIKQHRYTFRAGALKLSLGLIAATAMVLSAAAATAGIASASTTTNAAVVTGEYRSSAGIRQTSCALGIEGKNTRRANRFDSDVSLVASVSCHTGNIDIAGNSTLYDNNAGGTVLSVASNFGPTRSQDLTKPSESRGYFSEPYWNRRKFYEAHIVLTLNGLGAERWLTGDVGQQGVYCHGLTTRQLECWISVTFPQPGDAALEEATGAGEVQAGAEADCAPGASTSTMVPGEGHTGAVGTAEQGADGPSNTATGIGNVGLDAADDAASNGAVEETPAYTPEDDVCPGAGVRYHNSSTCVLSGRVYTPSLSGSVQLGEANPFCEYAGANTRAIVKVCLERQVITGFRQYDWETVQPCRTQRFSDRGMRAGMRTIARKRCRGTRFVRRYRTAARLTTIGTKTASRTAHSPYTDLRCTV